MTFATEPSDDVFDKHIDFFDEQGRKIPKMTGVAGLRKSTLGPEVHSVLLAEGLQLPGLDEDNLEELPRRFVSGSSKAKLTWFGAIMLTGIGMFVEAFIIITTGQIKSVWKAAFPLCFHPGGSAHCPDLVNCCNGFKNELETCGLNADELHYECNDEGDYLSDYTCSKNVIGGISYAEFAGIMLGMLTFGKIADLGGRHMAGMAAALFQVIGVGMMTFYRNSDLNLMFIVFDIFFFIFGFGIGGEYPLTAANAAAHHVDAIENASMDDTERHRIRVLKERERTNRRGETISMVFAQQGMGASVGSAFLCCLIYFSEQGTHNCEIDGHNPEGYSTESLDSVWRSFYFIGMIFVLMVLIYRGLVLEEGDGHLRLVARKERRAAKLGKQGKGMGSVMWFYGPRLVGTGGCWLLVDVAFYGLKLFSGPIFQAINPGGDLITNNSLLFVNTLCALAGYYCAASVIDRPWCGRVKLQCISNTVCTAIFVIAGLLFETASPGLLMFLYFFSSYCVNFGPNVTTYVMAAETYPTELRGTLHGTSAFLGKCGALFATIVFKFLEDDVPMIFYICAVTSGLGALCTIGFSVNLQGVSLAEHDAQLELFLEGKVHEYKGKLNDPKCLSLYERVTGRHGEYDPDWAVLYVKKMSKHNTDQGEAAIEKDVPEQAAPSAAIDDAGYDSFVQKLGM